MGANKKCTLTGVRCAVITNQPAKRFPQAATPPPHHTATAPLHCSCCLLPKQPGLTCRVCPPVAAPPAHRTLPPFRTAPRAPESPGQRCWAETVRAGRAAWQAGRQSDSQKGWAGGRFMHSAKQNITLALRAGNRCRPSSQHTPTPTNHRPTTAQPPPACLASPDCQCGAGP